MPESGSSRFLAIGPRPTDNRLGMRVRAVFGLVVACGAIALVATPVAARSRACGAIRARNTTFLVTVRRGSVTCATAQHVLSDFLHGRGTMHGPKNGPAYRQWWSVDGWRCGYGAAGGGCSHGRASILAQQDHVLRDNRPIGKLHAW
jgi:hypothetical protein